MDNISRLKATTADEEFRLGQILTELGQNDKALSYYYRAATKAADQPRFRCTFGFELLAVQRVDQAIAQFKKVNKQYPENAAGMLGLGIGLQMRDPQNEEASILIDSALAREPELKSQLDRFEHRLPTSGAFGG